MQVDDVEIEQPRIKVSKRQKEAWKYLEDKTTNEIGYGGAAGGGKSFLGCLWHIYRRATYPGSRGLVGRAKISNLEESTLVTLFNVANAMGYKQGVQFTYNSQKHVINWANGSKTILKDLFLYPSDPDFISLGSTEYTDAFIDEITEISQKAYEIVNSRIRYGMDRYGIIPKMFFTCNPSPGWVKDMFISKPLKPHQKFVRALLTDNPDESFKKLYNEQLERMSSDYDRERLLYGNWDAEREIMNPFMFNYDPNFHEDDRIKLDHQSQLYISLDFNLTPFAVIFAQVFRDNTGLHVWVCDELEIENGSVPAMVTAIADRYRILLGQSNITGDYNGSKGELSQADNASLFLQLIRGLRISERQLKIIPNPTHVNSRADCNYLLHWSKIPQSGLDFRINPTNCPNLCRDMRNVQCDINGSIIKRNRKDINQRGDFLDAGRYLIGTFVKPFLTQHQKNNR